MKRIFSLVLICIAIFNLTAFAAPKEYFYYGPDGKIFLKPSAEKILVRFSDRTDFVRQQSILSVENDVQALKEDQLLPAPKVTVAILKSGLSAEKVEALLARLNGNTQVLYANPFLVSDDGTLQGIQDKFLVHLKDASQYNTLVQTAARFHVTIDGADMYVSNLYHLSVNKSSAGNALDMANAFFETGLFQYSEPDFLRVMKVNTPNDPFLNNQWELKNTGTNTSQWGGTAGCDLNVFNAWGISTGSSSIKIAIIDEGVQLTHPDLSANLLAGYDAAGLGSNGGPNSSDAHGTNCAGIAAAVGNNSLGIAGVAYGCKIIPIRLGYEQPAGSGQLFTSDTWISNSFNYAWNTAGADVISNSWGGGSASSTITNAITAATTSGRGGKGSAVIFAAGNTNSSVQYPATLSNVISVAAMSMCNKRKSTSSCDGENFWGSSFGTNLDVAAPGVKIYATDLVGSAGYSNTDYYSAFNGTSSACPAVAGVMGLIYSVNSDLTLADARFDLESSCQKVGSYTYNSNVSGQPNGTWSTDLGYGRVDAYAAMLLAAGGGSCVDSNEPNNTKGTAASVSVGVDILSEISNAADIDWFKFSNTSGQPHIRVTLSTLPANYNIYLYNPSGTKVSNSSHSGTNDEEIIYNGGPVGTYKVKISGKSGAFSSTQCYTLNLLTGSSPFKLENNSTLSEVENALKIYPNPSSGTVSVEYNSINSSTLQLRIFDVTGKLKSNTDQQVSEGMNTLHPDLTNLNSGIYFMEISNGNETLRAKFMIEK